MLPKYIEQFNLIVDFHDISLLNLDLSILKSIFDVLTSLFPGCVNKIFFYNLSKSANFGMKMADLMLSPNLMQKMTYVEKGREEQIFFYTERRQIFKSLKGEIEDPNNYWPPVDTFSHLKQSERVDSATLEKLNLREFYILDEYDSQIFGRSLLMVLHKPWKGKGKEANINKSQNSQDRAFGVTAGQFRPDQPIQNLESEFMDPGVDLGGVRTDKEGNLVIEEVSKKEEDDRTVHQKVVPLRQSEEQIAKFDPTISEICMEADIIKMQDQFESSKKRSTIGSQQISLSKNTKSAIVNRLEHTEIQSKKQGSFQSPLRSKNTTQSMRNHTVQGGSQKDSIFGPLSSKTRTHVYAEKNSIRNKYYPLKKNPRPKTPSPEPERGMIDKLFDLVCCSTDKIEELGQEDNFWDKMKIKAVDFKDKMMPSGDKKETLQVDQKSPLKE